jgi:ABC-type sugar transport system permease subunit
MPDFPRPDPRLARLILTVLIVLSVLLLTTLVGLMFAGVSNHR